MRSRLIVTLISILLVIRSIDLPVNINYAHIEAIQGTPPNSCGVPGSQAGCAIVGVHYAFYTFWGQQVALPGIWCIDCGKPNSDIDNSNTISTYDNLLASDTGAQGARGNLTIENPGNDPYSSEEIRAANYVADHIFNGSGDNLNLRPAQGQRSPGGGTSDLVINGKMYDILSPTTNNVDSIFRSVYNKNSQAQGIILDLTDSAATQDQFSNLIGRLVGKANQDGVALNITDVYIINDVNNPQYVHLQYSPTNNP